MDSDNSSSSSDDSFVSLLVSSSMVSSDDELWYGTAVVGPCMFEPDAISDSETENDSSPTGAVLSYDYKNVKNWQAFLLYYLLCIYPALSMLSK